MKIEKAEYYPLYQALMRLPGLQGKQGLAVNIAETLYNLGYREVTEGVCPNPTIELSPQCCDRGYCDTVVTPTVGGQSEDNRVRQDSN